MKYTLYELPEGKTITNIDSNIVYNDVIKNFNNYCFSVSTACTEVQYYENNKLIASLFINVHINYGIYWRQESNAGKLAVCEKSKLNEIVWTKDVCDFSMGLFLPPELAWKGIKEFLKTGTASTEIEWISPNDIPEGGNY